MLLKYRFRSIVLTTIFLTALFFTVAGCLGSPFQLERANVTVKKLGNPLRQDGQSDRALNVWDLQVFKDKIYLAGGSTVTNAGPISVWAYDPGTQKFVREYSVDEEAIEHYRVFGNQLYIPAADPTQGDRNKFYRRQTNGQWQKYTSEAIKLAHVRDLIEVNSNEILMVGNSRQPDKPSGRGSALATATTEGLVFKTAGVNIQSNGVILADFNWFFSIFEYQDRIFAINSLLRDADNYGGSITEYNPTTRQLELADRLRNEEFIPLNLIGKNSSHGIDIIYRLWNPVEFQNYLIYPVRSYSITPKNYRQAYMNSIGFFYKSGMGNTPQRVKLPRRAMGEDVLIIDDELYALGNKKRRDDKYIIYVFKTDRLERKIKWQQVAKFASTNKARSFEYLDGTFYFGLGQDYGEKIGNSGDILSYTPQ